MRGRYETGDPTGVGEVRTNTIITIALALVAVTVLSGLALGETTTFDEEHEFAAGDYDDIMWGGDGITIGPESSYRPRWPLPYLAKGASGAYDDTSVNSPSILFANNSFHLYYGAVEGTTYSIGLARYSYGDAAWKKESKAVLEVGTTYDDGAVMDPFVIFEDGMFKMWYTAVSSKTGHSIAYATSTDGIAWTKSSSNPVLSKPSTGWGSARIEDPCVVRVDGNYYMFLTGVQVANEATVGLATSSSETGFTLYNSNPVMKDASPGDFGSQEVLDVCVIRDDPGFRMYFTGRNSATEDYQIGKAWSDDGYSWDMDPDVYIPPSIPFDVNQTRSPHAMYIDGEISIMYTGENATGVNRLIWGMVRGWYWDDHGHAVLTNGSTYDAYRLSDPCVIQMRHRLFHMYYYGYGTSGYSDSICIAQSTTPWGKWNKDGPVLVEGTSGTWDDTSVGDPCAMLVGEIIHLYYTGYGGGGTKEGIGLARGNTYSSLAREPGPVLTNGSHPRDWDYAGVSEPWVLRVGDTFHMWYSGYTSSFDKYIGHATSTDGTNWTKDPANPVIGPGFYQGYLETIWIAQPVVLYEDGEFTMYLSAGTTINTHQRIVTFSSTDGTSWTLDPHMPVLVESEYGAWDPNGVFPGSVLVINGMRHLYYMGFYLGSEHRIGHAVLGGTEGVYTTPVIDASSHWPVEWGSLTWDATLGLGSLVRFQVATNNGGPIWRFRGPSGTASSYFDTPGQAINQYQTGRFMRVRAYLSTDNESVGMPVLQSLSVHYQSRPSPSPPVVTLTSPNGGEDWMKTKQYPVTWTAVGNFGNQPVDLYYSTDNGSTWSTMYLNSANSGFYRWTVPSTETSGALVRIVVEDIDGAVADDVSDATFAIDPPPPKSGEFFAPATGTVMAPGTHAAEWAVHDPWGLADTPLTLELTTDGGMTWTLLADGLPLTDSFEWEVRDMTTSSTSCRLRLSILDWLGGISVIESGVFTIDVAAPEASMTNPGRLAEGEEVTIMATCCDDLGVEGVRLIVIGDDGTRAYDMESDGDGVWSVPYAPKKGDVSIHVIATDGVHDAKSHVHDVTITEAAIMGGAVSSLALTMTAVAGLALCVTIGVLLASRRWKGRGK